MNRKLTGTGGLLLSDERVGDVQAMIDRLKGVVALVSQTKDLDEWKARRLISETIVPRLDDIFQAKFVEIDQFHDLGKDTREVIHYTGLEMLVSVLSDKAKGKKAFIRMNDSFHLNDPEEGQYLGRRIEALDGDGWFGETKDLHAYIASFIIPDDKKDQELREEDDLRYWRSYGNEGKGCSIRFPVSDIPFRRVLYGQEKVKGALDTLDLTSIWNALQLLATARNERVSSTATDILSERIRRIIARILYLYKDDAYEYEQECRTVRSVLEIDESDIRFEPLDKMASPHSIRHYYQDSALSIDHILVTGSLVTIGPLVPRPHNVMYYVKTLLERAGLPGAKVEVSRIPYQEPLQ